MIDRKPKGLRTLSPDLIDQARDDTATQVSRILLTFVGTAAFCLLSLLSPDSALLAGSEKIMVPFTGPVSFFGFMMLGPAVLILLRIYLQIYVEHAGRLDRIANILPVVRAPTLIPLKNTLILAFSIFASYLLLPLIMIIFTWESAVFPSWGIGFIFVTGGVIVGHMIIPLRSFSWRARTIITVGVALIAMVLTITVYPIRRRFDLSRANLSGQMLNSYDLIGANLRSTNLSDANLSKANLVGAKMVGADLKRANLEYANLDGADLSNADLSDAKLGGARLVGIDLGEANLSRADLSGTDLSGMANLSGANLSGANLWGAYLKGAHLNNANLSGADLSKASLDSAELSEANLSGANLSNAFLGGANLSNANLSNTKMGDTYLDGQDQLNSACGTPQGLPVSLAEHAPKPCEVR